MADERPIIIKKIKKVAGHGHHGGAWKVAYADFVTAMMAFFLLMWLLNAASEEQKRGLSNYFGPSGNAVGAGGSGGVLGGQSIEKEGNFQETRASSPVDNGSPNVETTKAENTDGEQAGGVKSNLTADQAGAAKTIAEEMTAKDAAQAAVKQEKDHKAKAMIDQYETQVFKDVESKLKQAIREMPDLKDLAENLIIDQTPEGLRIQIVDQKRYSMFPNGSAEMYPPTRQLLLLVTRIVEKMPNKISISGHTDSKPYAEGATYTN